MLWVLIKVAAFLYMGLVVGMVVIGLREFRRMVDRVTQGQIPRTPLEDILAQMVPVSRCTVIPKKESEDLDG